MVRGMDQVEVGDSPIEVIRDTGNTSNYEAIARRSGRCRQGGACDQLKARAGHSYYDGV